MRRGARRWCGSRRWCVNGVTVALIVVLIVVLIFVSIECLDTSFVPPIASSPIRRLWCPRTSLFTCPGFQEVPAGKVASRHFLGMVGAPPLRVSPPHWECVHQPRHSVVCAREKGEFLRGRG